MNLSTEARFVAGLLLVTVPAIAYGGTFLLRLLKTRDSAYMNNPFRQNMFRAGHAHAGVLVLFGIICQFLVDASPQPQGIRWMLRLGVPCAAVLMPLGFFLSAVAPNATTPNRMIRLIYIGAAILALTTIALGVSLLRSL